MKKLSLISLKIILTFWDKVLPVYQTPSIQSGGCRLSLRCLDHDTQWCIFASPTPEPQRVVYLLKTGLGVVEYRFSLFGYCQVGVSLFFRRRKCSRYKRILGIGLEAGRVYPERGLDMTRDERLWGSLPGCATQWVARGPAASTSHGGLLKLQNPFLNHNLLLDWSNPVFLKWWSWGQKHQYHLGGKKIRFF